MSRVDKRDVDLCHAMQHPASMILVSASTASAMSCEHRSRQLQELEKPLLSFGNNASVN